MGDAWKWMMAVLTTGQEWAFEAELTASGEIPTGLMKIRKPCVMQVIQKDPAKPPSIHALPFTGFIFGISTHETAFLMPPSAVAFMQELTHEGVIANCEKVWNPDRLTAAEKRLAVVQGGKETLRRI